MTVNIEHRSPVEAKLRIQIPKATVSERITNYYSSLAKKAKIPGFRPGKAPSTVVKQMYGPDAASDLSERLISEFLMKAVEEHRLDLVMPPLLIATDQPDEEKDFAFEVEVHLRPQVPALKLEGLQVQVPKAEPVTDTEVDKEIDALREAEASFVDVSTPRAVGPKDCIVVNYSGTVDGEARPGMQAEQQTIVLGQQRYLPDFEGGMIGMKIGEIKTYDVKFPADYGEESLRNKTAQFTVTMSALKEKVLPELTDDFAKSADSEVQSLLELKLKIRKQLESNREQALVKQKKEAVGDALVEKHPFLLSPRQIESLAERLAHQTHQMMHQMGLPHEENEEHAKALVESSRKKAERDLRLTYILEAIARAQKFEVTAEDVKTRMEETAKRTGYSVSQIEAYYATKDEEDSLSKIDRLKIDILDEKSLDYALSKATIKIRG